jgi:diacylglycerol kinase family enzyme
MSAVPQPARVAPLAEPQPEFFILLNPGSGAGDKDAIRAAIESELRAAGRRYRFVPLDGGIVQACRQAARTASEQGAVLVAAGGDGTLNCMAQQAVATGCPLGMIALGTFNLFAREHGLPLDAAAATRVLLQSRPEPVQVGLVNERVFLVNASVGLYPKLLADREQVKQKLGRKRWIAMLAGLFTLFEWRLQLRLDADLDGHITHVRTPSLFVCNNRLQLRRLGIAEEVVEKVGEGRLAGLVARTITTGAKLRLLWRGLRGTLGETRELQSFNLRALTVSTRNARRLKVATDGEVLWMELPLRFAVSTRPLQLMLPPPDQRLSPE